MIGTIHYWLAVFFYLGSSCYALLIVGRIVKMLLKKLNWLDSLERKFGKLVKSVTSTSARNFIAKCACVAVGILIGVAGTDIKRHWSIEERYGLHVLYNNGLDTYVVDDGVHKPFAMKFCADYIPEFVDDSLIEWIKYEQKPQCINVRDRELGFHVKRYLGIPVKFSTLSGKR